MDLQDHFAAVTSFFSSTTVPSVGCLFKAEESVGTTQEYTAKEGEHYLNLIHMIMEDCSSQPENVVITLFFTDSIS